MQVVKSYGFQIPKSKIATNEDYCVNLCEEVGYPVVNQNIVHKVDVGGVELNLKNAREVRDSFRRIVQNVRQAKGDAKIVGINIQEFIKGGKEVIIGMKRDHQFGPLLMFGLGGIYVEIFRDVSFQTCTNKGIGCTPYDRLNKSQQILLGTRG